MAVSKKTKNPLNAKLSYFVLSLGIGIGLFSLYWRWSLLREGTALSEEELCSVTSRVKEIRRSKGNLHIDPAKIVIDDLIQIVPPAKFVCPYGFLNLFSTLCHWPVLNGVCEKKQKDGARTLLVLVSSARSNFASRESIRRTWGSLWEYEGWQIRVIFFVGQSKFCLYESDNSTEDDVRKGESEALTEEADLKEDAVLTEDAALKEEAERYGDIVFAVFTDTYRNVTYKTLTSYKFVLDHCPEADLVMKTDDDRFPDIPTILDKRNEDLNLELERKERNIYDMYCYLNSGIKVIRERHHQFEVTYDEWPADVPFYPPYCCGGTMLTTTDWIRKIYSARLLEPFFWIEDVFVNGKLRAAAEKIYKSGIDGPAKIFDLKTNETDAELDFVLKSCWVGVLWNERGWFLMIDTHGPGFPERFLCIWKILLQRLKKKSANFIIKNRFSG